MERGHSSLAQRLASLSGFAIVIASLVAALPARASAAENGLKVGAGRLHPYLDIEGRYDTLAGYVEDTSGTEPRLIPTGDLILRYRPGFKLDVPSDVLTFSLGGNVEYVHYLGIESEGTAEQSRFGGQGDLSLLFNGKGVVAVEVADSYVRSDRSSNLALGVGTVVDHNDARLKLIIAPGGGALVFEPGYTLGYEHYVDRPGALPEGCTSGDPSCDSNAVSKLDYLQHTADLDVRWRFLPKTSVVLDSSYSLRGYLDDATASQDSQNVKALAGIVGLLFPKIAVTAKAGWGQQIGAGYASVVGTGEVAYLLSEQADVRLGYVRTFEPSPSAGGYYSDDRGYVGGKALLGGKLTMKADASYDYIDFGGTRFDSQVTAGVAPSFEFTDWLNAGLGYQLTWRDSTDDRIGFDFVRHEAIARVQLIY